MTDLERRFTRGPVEIRAETEQTRTIGGYAAKFNKLSRDLGGFVERIDPRFFNKSAGDGWPDVLARYNHDDNMLLGTTAAGTLRLHLDSVGLDYTVDLPQHRGDVWELVARGDVRQSSFAFFTLEDDWGVTEQGYPLRTLLSGRLVDVAPVNTPAYPDTSTGLRSLAERVSVDVAEVERLARAGELRKLLGGPQPTVIDLAGTESRAGDSGPSKGDQDEVRSGFAETGQSEPHPVSVSKQQRRAWVRDHEFSPLAQGEPHAAQ